MVKKVSPENFSSVKTLQNMTFGGYMNSTIMILFYFMPSIIGALKDNNIRKVFLLNFFLGWTVIGWFVAFGLACSRKRWAAE